jgi:hypothetical protein
VHISDLRERQAKLKAAIDRIEGETPPLVVSSMERLTGLLDKAEPILEPLPPVEQETTSRPRNLP